MADLGLNDRLQPALLDRLLDDERTIALVKVMVDVKAAERLQLPLKAVQEILRGQGLNLQSEQPAGDFVELRFTASRAHASPAELRSVRIRPPGAPLGIELQAFATVESTSIHNTELEPTERRLLSRSKLRECVLRDLGWLFNSLSLESSQDLTPYPQVRESVLNYGLPSFAGRMISSIDPPQAAERLRRAIELFEPRLRNVQVRPLDADEVLSDGTLEFAVEAELWGQPVSQHLELHTRIDILTGDVSVAEARGGHPASA